MPSLAAPLVSVIIPHYNDLENLQCCLDSLRRQSLASGRCEIIVADNNSIGGVAAIREMAPDVVAVPAFEQGAGPARNAAASVARGAYLAFIDSDCVADRDWLVEGLAALERFDYVGGQVVTTMRDPKRPTAAEAFEAAFAFNFKRYIEKEKFSGSGNLFVPRPVFERVGGFRGQVSEDVDWCRRANALGFRLGYAKRAIVYHAARHEWADLARKWDRLMTEALRLAMEQPRWRLQWTVRAAIVFLSPLVHWASILRNRRLVGPYAKARGVFGLLRIRTYRGRRMIRLLTRPLG